MKEHKRLTERKGDGVFYLTREYEITCYPKNNNLSNMDKIAVKLCELEDKLEDGELVSKAEAVKEFAEKLKRKVGRNYVGNSMPEIIDEFLKEYEK